MYVACPPTTLSRVPPSYTSSLLQTDALQSLDRFRDFAEGRKLIANTDFKEGSLLHLRLIDPEIPQSTINADILREGLASLDTGVKYYGAYKTVVSKLEEGEYMNARY